MILFFIRDGSKRLVGMVSEEVMNTSIYGKPDARALFELKKFVDRHESRPVTVTSNSTFKLLRASVLLFFLPQMSS